VSSVVFKKKRVGTCYTFYNCGSYEPMSFFGQKKGGQFQTFLSSNLSTSRPGGDVGDVGCCFGAQHNPNETETKTNVLPTIILQINTNCFLGSSNISYGPGNSRDAADILTQTFTKYSQRELQPAAPF